MAWQIDAASRDAQNDAYETTVGTAPTLEVRTGAPPANCAAADSGTVIATITLPSDWAAASSGGSKAKSGTWSAASSNSGTPGHFRLKSSGGTVRGQGTCGQSVVIATNGVTSANGNVLNFASTTGVVVGMNVSGTGVVAGSRVVAVTGTTVTLSHTSTAGVGSAVSITFAYDLPVDAASVTAGQVVTINTFTINRGNA